MTASIKGARITWANELVPLSQRMTYLDVFRGAAAVLVAVTAGFVQIDGTAGPSVLVATALYGAITVGGGALWRVLRRRSLTLFGALIITDGLYFAWITYASGGAASPFRYLILLHLITVTLLASYRTGLKLALWHSMLLLSMFHLTKAGVLPLGKGAAGGPDVVQTAAFMVVFWLAAFLTATLAAVNERELRRRKVDVEALAAMATELETTTDAGALAAVLVTNVMRHFGPRRVALLRASDRKLSLWEFEGEPKGCDDPFAPRDASVLIEVLRLRGTALVRDLDPEMDAGLAEMLPDAQNLVVVPLTAESGMIGVLVVEYGGRSTRIARRAVDILERFASHGALALRNALLVEQMEQLATVDGLTGVANRRTFDDVLDKAIRRGGRLHNSVSLILADIDHFKALNDAHGHKVGDQALHSVAMTLSSHIRSIDTVARYGGEEFAIVMPNCGPDEAAARAEELRRSIERELKTHKVTLSFGVATYPMHSPNADRLVGASDKALYRSKAAGRNTVTVFTPGVDELPGRSRPAKQPARRSKRAPTKQKARSQEVKRDVA
jgi:diguanylate cyclase (GGDEF)-like protein